MKPKFSYKVNFYMLLAALSSFTVINYGIIKAENHSYLQHRTEYQEILLTLVSSNIELALSISDKNQIDESLIQYQDNIYIHSINVYDSKNNLISTMTNTKKAHLKSHDLEVLRKEVIESNRVQAEREDIFIQDQELNAPNNLSLGAIEVSMPKSDPLENIFLINKNRLFANFLLLIVIALLWFYILKKTKRDKKDIARISKIAKGSNYISSYTMSTSEAMLLQELILEDKKNNSQQQEQLSLLKREIKQAREDGNIELHQFISFLNQFGTDNYKKQLKVFYKSVLSYEKQEKSWLDVRQLIVEVLTAKSILAEEKNINIYDTYTGKCADHDIYIDKRLFSKFLDLFIKDIILVCTDNDLKLNVDLRDTHKSCMLRISFESKSPKFVEALAQQSLLHFDITLPITKFSNNINLISSKHLMQKSGGEYFYFKNEIRFEFIIKARQRKQAKAPSVIWKPLNSELDILVYDSDPVDRMVLMGYLEKFNLTIDQATTKQVVLQKVRRSYYDCLFVNADFFSEQDPYFIKNFKSEYENNNNSMTIFLVCDNLDAINNELLNDFSAIYIPRPVDFVKLRKQLQLISK